MRRADNYKYILFFCLSAMLLLFQLPGRCRFEYAAAYFAGQPLPIDSTTKIPIDGSRWYQVNSGRNDLARLFDGDTDTNAGSDYDRMLQTYEAYYRLDSGEQMTIKQIRMFDGEGVYTDKPMRLYIIDKDWKRQLIATFTGTKYNAWVGPNPSSLTNLNLTTPVTTARYLLIQTNGFFPTEIELYGGYTPGIRPSTGRFTTAATLNDMFGVNAFEWNFERAETPWQVDSISFNSVKTFSGVRHYADWEKLELTKGSYSYNPVISGGWNYDAIYEKCKAENIAVLACIKTQPPWMQASYPDSLRDYENSPIYYGKDAGAVASYIDQAKVAFQFAARYGSNKNVSPTLVKVNTKPRWPGDQPNAVKIGLGYIKYIECDNERDKTWKGRLAYQSAREYATNLSAFYDGHKRTMGTNVGVKTADPTMQVVIGGLAASSTDYVRAMIDWCRQNRGYNADGSVNVCWDVINYHLYSTNETYSTSGSATRGAAPEKSLIGQQAAAMVKMAREALNNMPVWITETGYDLNQGSPVKAIPIGKKTALQTQADWTLRTALLLARVGIAKNFFYQLTDDQPEIPVQYYSMGLIDSNKTLRPAAQYILQTRRLLGSFTFVKTIGTDPLVDQYISGGKTAYSLVIPDEVGRTKNYVLPVPAGQKATLYTLKPGGSDMTAKALTITNQATTIAVSETPCFVIVEGAAQKFTVNPAYVRR